MAAVQNLCTKTIVFSNGKAIFYGETDSALKKYLAESDHGTRNNLNACREERYRKDPVIQAVRLLDKDNAER